MIQRRKGVHGEGSLCREKRRTLGRRGGGVTTNKKGV